MGKNWQMEDMLRAVERDYEYTRGMTGREALPDRIRQALAEVPRHEFVPAGMRDAAYENHPLPIGHGQTISQPYIVALMTDLLETGPDDTVLEVGAGCGYQAAVLSRLVRHVYAVEIVPELAESAAKRLSSLGYANVSVRAGDGRRGLPEYAPYAGIMVTAAAEEVPSSLVEQLRSGGRLVIPLGEPYGPQVLSVIVKGEDGTAARRDVLAVAFVPLTGPR